MIVLDTHVMIWWASGQADKLSPVAAEAIDAERDGGQVVISSISAWEVAMLVEKGRLQLAADVEHWLGLVRDVPAVEFVPVDNAIAVDSVRLPGDFHADPADRIIVATARKLTARLVTADEKIRGYPHAATLW